MSAVFSICVFVALFISAFACAIAGAWVLFGLLPATEFRAIITVAVWLVLFPVFAILVFRLFQATFPLPPGIVEENSREDRIYQIYVLFYLLVFSPLMTSGFLPIPLMRLFYQSIGVKMGSNTYSAGVVMDAQFVRLGSNTIIGFGAVLIPHVIEGRLLAHYPIEIGSNVTVGARSVIMSDVKIGDRATIAINSVVTKGTRIGPGETWGGSPARLLKADTGATK